MKFYRSILIAGCIFFLASFRQDIALSANGESTLDKIQRTGTLSVALRVDSPPFGFQDSRKASQGYCLDFFALLNEQLIEKLERNTLSLKLLKSNPSNRFRLVANSIVDLECGPNTILPQVLEGIDFSASFFASGTQFLIKKNNPVDFEGDLEGLRLGVITNTTTEKFLAQRYPLATLLKYGGTTARNRGIEAVEQGKLDAMVSDGVLLRAEAQQQGLSSRGYLLIPENPLTCDRYGMIIRSNDSEWQDFVNTVIQSPEAQALANSWFGRLFDSSQPAEDECLSK